jgi:hypothetical protein
MKDCIAHQELEMFVGSDDIVRINVDGICQLRVRVKLSDIRLVCVDSTPDMQVDADPQINTFDFISTSGRN